MSHTVLEWVPSQQRVANAKPIISSLLLLKAHPAAHPQRFDFSSPLIRNGRSSADMSTVYGAIGAESGGGGNDPTKQGTSCCGFCCDMRRAVIILNLVILASSIIILIFQAGIHEEAKETDDDQYRSELEDTEKAFMNQMAFLVFGFVFSMWAIYGAVKYQILPVGSNVVYLIVQFVATGVLGTKAAVSFNSYDYVSLWVSNVVTTGLFIYPHVMFVREVRVGIMSPETYSTSEKQSCCCV